SLAADEREHFRAAFAAAELSKAKLEQIIRSVKSGSLKAEDLAKILKESSKAIAEAKKFLLKLS
ncbi:MAG: hypothetical protein ACREF7_03255, partial [Candidatus Saccharimonadales bacterium]